MLRELKFFSLAAGNFLYDVVPPEKRAAYSAVHQTLSNSAIFTGALIGGSLATHAPHALPPTRPKGRS